MPNIEERTATLHLCIGGEFLKVNEQQPNFQKLLCLHYHLGKNLTQVIEA